MMLRFTSSCKFYKRRQTVLKNFRKIPKILKAGFSFPFQIVLKTVDWEIAITEIIHDNIMTKLFLLGSTFSLLMGFQSHLRKIKVYNKHLVEL